MDRIGLSEAVAGATSHRVYRAIGGGNTAGASSLRPSRKPYCGIG